MQQILTHDLPKQEDQQNTIYTVTKTYSELRRGDIIETYIAAKWQRCKVVDIQPDRPETVRIQLKRDTSKLIEKWQVFAANALVQVVQREQITDRYRDLLVQVQPPTEPAHREKELLAVAQELGLNKELNRYHLRQAIRNLSSKGLIIEKHTRRYPTYRQPIPRVIGFSVVEHLGKKSERYGYYSGLKYCASTKQAEPVYTWISGGCSFSNEQFLDPVALGWKSTWIGIGRRIVETGDRLEPEITLPLIARLLKREQFAFIELADLLEIPHASPRCLQGTERAMLINWLEFVQPSWVQKEG